MSRTWAFFERERGRLALAALALVFCTAPTPGDIGGCGQKPAELDPGIFFASKANIDCQRCTECSIASKACSDACAGRYLDAFPARCLPLVHDGEVCLRALQYASCADYDSYENDSAPGVPTECNFCPEPTQ